MDMKHESNQKESKMSELEEKFVADDGVSSVPSPVTPAGGEVKKRRADVKKVVDAKAGTVAKPPMSEAEEAEDEIIEEEIISIEESIQNMFEGMDLSEEFKSKVALVFEAAVNETVNSRLEEALTKLEADFEEKLQDSINESIEEVLENLDSYLDYVVNEWMKENKVAIEAGIKVEMAESLMDGLRELFTEHNIAIDEETLDVVLDLEERAASLEETANEVINENLELKKEIESLRAGIAFEQVSEGLTVSQKERLRVLSEKLDTSDIDVYESDLSTLKESFFKTKKAQAINEEAEDEVLTEETSFVKKPASQYSTVNAIVEALNKKHAK
jgi:hypothetical protein